MNRIHILGASGSGTSTLGEALSKLLPYKHLDTDDYYWKKKYTEKREVEARIKLLSEDISNSENWILSGSLVGWGDIFIPQFDLVIFLWIPEDIRLERLRQREFKRYGNEIFLGGNQYEQFQEFMDWASLYDKAGLEVRSKVLHEEWIANLPCPVLRIEGNHSVEERVDMVLDYLRVKLF